jgi:Domain of unknown function (DUF3291)
MPAFLSYTLASQYQVVRAAGFCGGRLLIDRRRTFWTLTAWQDEKTMKAFRGSGAHARVMPRLVNWCDEAAYAHWIAPDGKLPEWTEAYEHLLKEGRLSRVTHATADHTAQRFAAPRLQPLTGQELHPVSRTKAA